ncbi:hypothetical protein FHS10_002787 [Mucilaginibacter dorajii]|nr:hypothetical protein [Mucilaginibacter dorajii]
MPMAGYSLYLLPTGDFTSLFDIGRSVFDIKINLKSWLPQTQRNYPPKYQYTCNKPSFTVIFIKHP